MDGAVRIIHPIIRADIAQGKIIDVETYCRVFAPMFPELTRKQIEHAVLQIVIVYGGSAAWGPGNPPGNGGNDRGSGSPAQ